MAAFPLVPLAHVASIDRIAAQPSSIDEGTLFVGLENIESGGRLTGVRRVSAGELASTKFRFTPQHILYGKLRPYLAKIARPDFMGVCSTDILPLAPGPKLDQAYLAQVLLTPGMVATAASLATGANLPRLSPTALARLVIPLPPLPEQRRIAAILDQADTLRAKRREALAKLDELTQAIFLDMFGDPATNPKGWPVRSIGDLCLVKGGKRLPKGEAYSQHPTPFRYIRVTDLRAGVVDEAQLVYLPPEVQVRIKRYTVHVGDVIISIAGSIGLVAAVPSSLDGANLTENAAKLVPRQTSEYDSEYLAAVLRTSHLQGQITSHTGQVTIGKLALFRIEQLSLPLPPLGLQDEFAARIRDLRGLRAHLTNSALGLDTLFLSLQHRAFRGEL